MVGAIALAMMLLVEPWDLNSCDPANCNTVYGGMGLFTFFHAAISTLFVGIVLTVVLVGILGIRDSGRASETAVYAALGQSQGTAARQAARRGAIDGAIVTGGAFVVTGVVQMWLVLNSGWPLFSQASDLWISRFVFAVAFTGYLCLAHVIDAVRPRRTPVERLHEDAAPPRPRRIPIRTRALLLAAIAAASVGVLAGVAVAHDPATGDAGTIPTLLAQSAMAALWLALVSFFFFVAVPIARGKVPIAVGAAATVAGLARATQASALLRARLATASGTFTRTFLAIAGLALLFGASSTADPSPALSPNHLATVTIEPASAAAGLVEQYEQVDGVSAVVPAMQYGEWPQVIAVDPADLAEVDEALADQLTTHPEVIVDGTGSPDVTLDDFAAQGIHAVGRVVTSTCCAAFANPAIVAGEPYAGSLIVYAEPGADPYAVAVAVEALVPGVPAVSGWSMASAYGPDGTANVWGNLFTVVLVGLVLLGPVVALAVGVVSRRRRDDATLGALGASRRTLTIAAMAETTAIAFVAIAIGLLGGAAMTIAWAMASAAQGSLTGLITENYLRVGVLSVAWGRLGLILVGSVAVFAVVAAVASLLRRSQLPAEELRAVEAGRL